MPFGIWNLFFTLLAVSLGLVVYSGDVKPRKEHYLPNYKIYHNLSSISKTIRHLINNNKQYIRLFPDHRSKHNNQQFVLHVTNFSQPTNKEKVKILLSFGEHAREFIPIESLIYLLQNLTEGVFGNADSPAYKFSSKILSNIDLFIITIVNPDGREKLEATNNFCWRGLANGVDIERNFDWEFGNEGSSGKIDDEEYRGPWPFSEIEGHILRDITNQVKFDLFASMHSGIRTIYLPYADTKSKKTRREPDNLSEMLELASHMSSAGPNSYKYGIGNEINEYTADGTIYDYMKGVRKIPFSYTIELWGEGDFPEKACFDLFNPKSDNLMSSLEEIHPLYETMFDYMIRWKYKKIHALNIENDVPSLTLGFMLLVFVVLVTVCYAANKSLPTWVRLFPRRRIVNLRSLHTTFTSFR